MGTTPCNRNPLLRERVRKTERERERVHERERERRTEREREKARGRVKWNICRPNS